MHLNISDEELIYNPREADIERAIASLVVEPEVEHGEEWPDPSFAVLIQTDWQSDFLSAQKITRLKVQGRKLPYTLAFRDASTGRAYRCWVPSQVLVVALFKKFRDGEALLPQGLAYGFVWCDHTEWAGELAQTPPGCDEAEEERLEEEACISVGDVVDAMMSVRDHDPELAEMLEAGADDPDAPSNQGPILTRADSLAWMRVSIGEDAVTQLPRLRRLWPAMSEKKQRSARRDWAGKMRSLARLARDREAWSTSAELEAKWIELRLAFRQELPAIIALRLAAPPAALIEDSSESK